MSQNLRGSWGSVYAIDANSTIALQGGEPRSVYSENELQRSSARAERAEYARREQKKKSRSLRVPAWVVVVFAAVLLFSVAMGYLVCDKEIKAAGKQLESMRSEYARVYQTREALKIRVNEKADATRIRAIAINRLGMRQATPDITYTVVPVSHQAAAQPETSAWDDQAKTSSAKSQGDGFLGLLLHMIGL